MKALITGASAGIGRALALRLSQEGYNLILTARNINKLNDFQHSIKTNSKILIADLSDLNQCISLYEQVCNEDIDIVINNAGFGVFGEFSKTSLENEISMLNVNITAVHILTKMFLQKFLLKNQGSILNVASSAGFFPGPLFSSYYASKAYVVRLTLAIYEELRRNGSNVYIGALCPGPVATDFNKNAGITGFSAKPLTAEKVAEYTIKKMKDGKTIIIPGLKMKLTHALGRLLPDKTQAHLAYDLQLNKLKTPSN